MKRLLIAVVAVVAGLMLGSPRRSADAQTTTGPVTPTLNFDSSGNLISMTPSQSVAPLGCVKRLDFFDGQGKLVGTTFGQPSAPGPVSTY